MGVTNEKSAERFDTSDVRVAGCSTPSRFRSKTTPMIEVEALSKRFGATEALTAVDLVAPKGTVVALLGPNGAGKTTLVR
ncbi:MAG TPA: ATP-binding cassette domain-containing protein, partial [Baekduia sp.]|uniref:ATP-binding cassette domain-containing protein n=1 Tax=Baekduia sp. TaxID=2600305 RepID=UPI002D79B7D0